MEQRRYKMNVVGVGAGGHVSSTYCEHGYLIICRRTGPTVQLSIFYLFARIHFCFCERFWRRNKKIVQQQLWLQTFNSKSYLDKIVLRVVVFFAIQYLENISTNSSHAISRFMNISAESNIVEKMQCIVWILLLPTKKLIHPYIAKVLFFNALLEDFYH